MIKIAIMGPESTGKSSISKDLADYYKTVWVPEFAREYCKKLDRPATLDDEFEILKGQINLENQYLPFAKELLICDTMFLTVKIYSEYVFGAYPKEFNSYLSSHSYDLFLIMNIDLPWEEDPLREFPMLRDYFMKIHIREIEALKVPYKIISGSGDDRLRNAISYIDSYLKKF